MSMRAWRQLPSRLMGSAVMALELAAGLGLVSGVTVALFIGRFMLAAWLALALLGIVLRFTRRRARGREAAGKQAAQVGPGGVPRGPAGGAIVVIQRHARPRNGPPY